MAYERRQEAREATRGAEKREFQLAERSIVKAVARRPKDRNNVELAFGEKTEFKAGGGIGVIELQRSRVQR